MVLDVKNYREKEIIKKELKKNNGKITNKNIVEIIYKSLPEKDILKTKFEIRRHILNMLILLEDKGINANYDQIINSNIEEIYRINQLKLYMRSFSNDPLIMQRPVVIDYKKYLKSKELKNNTDCIIIKGNFKVVAAFECGIILKCIDGSKSYYKVKLPLHVVKYIREDDVLNLTLARKMFMLYWDILKVESCFPG